MLLPPLEEDGYDGGHKEKPLRTPSRMATKTDPYWFLLLILVALVPCLACWPACLSVCQVSAKEREVMGLRAVSVSSPTVAGRSCFLAQASVFAQPDWSSKRTAPSWLPSAFSLEEYECKIQREQLPFYASPSNDKTLSTLPPPADVESSLQFYIKMYLFLLLKDSQSETSQRLKEIKKEMIELKTNKVYGRDLCF